MIQNPKRTIGGKVGKSTWYDYYASYSAQFVRESILNSNLPVGSSIMDPWNGSGTTTQIAEEMGYISYGYDINPVMIIIAKAKRLEHSVKDSLFSVSNDIIKKARRYRKSFCDITDPLETWFTQEAVNGFRNIERAIQQLLINDITGHKFLKEINSDIISSLAAFYYVALFRTLKFFLAEYKCSNPTWIKVPKDGEQKVKISAYEICNSFQQSVILMINAFTDTHTTSISNPGAVIKVASSTSIPLTDKQIDMVITSPPYCTRIDYVVNTLPELALMGFFPTKEDIQKIRNEMIGTPTIIKSALTTETSWGSVCSQFLEKVRNHESKASESYYLKNYLQYFNGIYKSLKEIDRTLKHNGKCIFVIQDSYYKEIHLDIVSIYNEMGNLLSWKLENKTDFPNKHSMSGINKNGSKYRKHTKATESVLVFRKL